MSVGPGGLSKGKRIRAVLMYEQGESTQAIAAFLRRSPAAVHRALVDEGVQLRPSRLPSRPARHAG